MSLGPRTIVSPSTSKFHGKSTSLLSLYVHVVVIDGDFGDLISMYVVSSCEPAV